MVLTLGVVVAQVINTYTRQLHPWGWRVSLGLAGVPALVLTLGGVFLPETPNSLIERGYEAEGRAVGHPFDPFPPPASAVMHACRVTLA